MQIDRLSLRLTGLSQEDAATVGKRVAQRLSEADLHCSRDVTVPRLSQETTGRAGENPHELADRIAAEILRSIERSV